MKSKFPLSIILPVYNEQDNIKKTIEDSIVFLKDQDLFTEYEIIAVNDGSTDGTASILGELITDIKCLSIITHPKNLGYGMALISGIKKARFPWILVMDADGQFKISSLEKFKDHFANYDVITGYRPKRKDPFHRLFLARTYTFLTWVLFGLKLKDINCGFKLFRREALNCDSLQRYPGISFANMLIQAQRKGYKIKQIPVEHFSRLQGEPTGASLKVVWRTVSDILRLKFSTEGLRVTCR